MRIGAPNHTEFVLALSPLNATVLAVAVFLSSAPSQTAFGQSGNAKWEAELLALELSGEILPPVDLTNKIHEDLELIREIYPPMSSISARPNWVVGEVLVGLTDDAVNDFRNGEYDAWDPLFVDLGTPDISTTLLRFGTVRLSFDQPYHPDVLAQRFANVNGIDYAQSNGIIGGGNDVEANPPLYTFYERFGDCPAGCIHEESWLFDVSNDMVIPVVGSSLDECDFNSRNGCNHEDLNNTDGLYSVGDLSAGVPVDSTNFIFDLTGDSMVGVADLTQWLSKAASFNGYNTPYRRGDTNFDMDVDITDFHALVTNFDFDGDTNHNDWPEGNFDGDGDVDITDFDYMANNFSPIGYGSTNSIPEPSASFLALIGLLVFLKFSRVVRT